MVTVEPTVTPSWAKQAASRSVRARAPPWSACGRGRSVRIDVDPRQPTAEAPRRTTSRSLHPPRLPWHGPRAESRTSATLARTAARPIWPFSTPLQNAAPNAHRTVPGLRAQVDANCARGVTRLSVDRTRAAALDQRKRCDSRNGRAEGVGFEPTVSCPTHAFQACRFGRSRIPPGASMLPAPCTLPGGPC